MKSEYRITLNTNYFMYEYRVTMDTNYIMS